MRPRLVDIAAPLTLASLVTWGLAACDHESLTAPDPRFEPTCAAMVAAACADSPTSVESCVASFSNAQPRCIDTMTDLIDCAGATPTAYCHPAGIAMIDGCDALSGNAIICATSP